MKLRTFSLMALFLLFFLSACGYPPAESNLSSVEEAIPSVKNLIITEGEAYVHILVPLHLKGLPTDEENARIIGQVTIYILDKNLEYSLVSREVFWRPTTNLYKERIYGMEFIFKK